MICNPYSNNLPNFARLYILGAGGFAREVSWLASQCWGSDVTSVFLVTKEVYLRPQINNVTCELLSRINIDAESRYVIAISEPAIRKQLTLSCEATGLTATTIIHPRFEASSWVEIGDGCIICCGVVATTNIKIGRHVHINLNCTIGHDVEIGDYCTLSPGVHVSGNVRIGARVFIGTGVNIINGTSSAPLIIGDNAVIAAGACVTKSVEPNSMVAGVPAVKKR